MRTELDMHTHTVVSGHAYNSLREMAQAASHKGLKALGITEHAPAMPGTCCDFYFHNLKILPREMCGVELFLGAEVNILDYEGAMDLADREMKNLDIIIASMHQPCVKAGNMQENTQAYLKVMENPYVNVIGHPDDARFPVDYERLIQGAKEHGKVIEINNHSLSPLSFRAGARENDLEILKLCKKYRVPVLLGSDAHFDTYIGEFSYALELVAETNFPQELILNTDLELLKPYTNKYRVVKG